MKKSEFVVVLREGIANALLREPEIQNVWKNVVLDTFNSQTGKPMTADQRFDWLVTQITQNIAKQLKSDPNVKGVFLKNLEKQRAAALLQGKTVPNPMDPDEIERSRAASQLSQPTAPPVSQTGPGTQRIPTARINNTPPTRQSD